MAFVKLLEFLGNITFKRFVVIGFIAVLVIYAFPMIDHYFYYNFRMSKRVELLDKVSQLNHEAISNIKILLDEYNGVLAEIQAHGRGFPVNLTTTQTDRTIKSFKFLTGAFWSILVILLSPLIYKKDIKNMAIAIILFATLGAFLGLISTAIPTFVNPLINYAGVPLLQFVLVMMLIVVSKGNKHNGKDHNIA